VAEGLVTRIREEIIPPNDVGVTLDLILGPTGELTEEQLKLAWR
jgi:hypothetical protein